MWNISLSIEYASLVAISDGHCLGWNIMNLLTRHANVSWKFITLKARSDQKHYSIDLTTSQYIPSKSYQQFPGVPTGPVQASSVLIPAALQAGTVIVRLIVS
jgi:hypothetical protein